MRRMGVLAILGSAAVALMLGTALAGEQPSVTILKQSASSVPPADRPTPWMSQCNQCYQCHRPWGHIYEVPTPYPNPPGWNPDVRGAERLGVRSISGHLESIPQPHALARK